jgi:hypothetical protein
MAVVCVVEVDRVEWQAVLVECVDGSSVSARYHDLLAFFASSKGNVTTPRLATLPLPDLMSVTLIQPRKREVRWTNLGYRLGLVQIATRKLDLQGLGPSGVHSRMQPQRCRTPHLGFVAYRWQDCGNLN